VSGDTTDRISNHRIRRRRVATFTLAAFAPGQQPREPTEQMVGWAPQPGHTFWRQIIYLVDRKANCKISGPERDAGLVHFSTSPYWLNYLASLSSQTSHEVRETGKCRQYSNTLGGAMIQGSDPEDKRLLSSLQHPTCRSVGIEVSFKTGKAAED
jgi:hypothetical protein